jgi:hypothetical protein
MKNKKKFLFVLLLIFIISLSWFVFNLVPLEVYSYETDLNVLENNRYGFNVANDSLHFGILPAGGSADRDIFMRGGKKSGVKIKAFGAIKDWVRTSDNNFLINEGEEKIVTIFMKVPLGTEKGFYNGTVKIYTYRPTGLYMSNFFSN